MRTQLQGSLIAINLERAARSSMCDTWKLREKDPLGLRRQIRNGVRA